MPIQLGKHVPMDEAAFDELRRTHGGWIYNPAMATLLADVHRLGIVKIELLPGQNPRSVRSAVSNSARARGMRVETLAGEDYVAVRYVGPYEEAAP